MAMDNRKYDLSALLLFSPALTLFAASCSPKETNQRDESNRITAPHNDRTLCEGRRVAGSGEDRMVDISEDICKKFEVHKDDPAHEEQVIITLKDGAVRPDLKGDGIRIVSEMGNISILVAKVTASGLRILSERDDIVRVEPDGEMRILEN